MNRTIDGWDIQEEPINSVKEEKDGWEIKYIGGMVFYLDKKYGYIPKKGDIVTLYTSNFSFIRGMDINGKRIFYTTKEEAEQQRLDYIKKQDKKEQRELKKSKEERDKRRSALPQAFQDRLNRFESRNPNWRKKYETYELFVCEQAVNLANLPKDKSINAWYKWFKDLKYDRQKNIWLEMDRDHSGNTFGMSVHLAHAYNLGMNDYIVNYHGAIAPLVGCIEYGCHE